MPELEAQLEDEKDTAPEMPHSRSKRDVEFALDRDVQQLKREIFGEGRNPGMRTILLSLEAKVDLLAMQLHNAILAGEQNAYPRWFWPGLRVAIGLWMGVGCLFALAKLQDIGAKLHTLGLW